MKSQLQLMPLLHKTQSFICNKALNLGIHMHMHDWIDTYTHLDVDGVMIFMFTGCVIECDSMMICLSSHTLV